VLQLSGKVGLCGVPRPPIEGAKIIDEVDVHPVSLILLKFLSLSAVALV